MTTARDSAIAVLLNIGTVLIAGGESQGLYALSSAEVYDPVAGTFTPTDSMGGSRADPMAVLLNNGTVLVAGGFDANWNFVASAELYETGTFTPPGLVSIAVTPASPSTGVGGWQQFVATGTFSDQSQQTLQSVTWSSTNTSVATVTNDPINHGEALGLAAGNTYVKACDGSVCGQTNLTVTLSGYRAPSTVTLALTAGANPSVYGSPLTFTATVSGSVGTPTGTVTLYDGVTNLGSTSVGGNGTATWSIPWLSVANHYLTAAYSGDANYNGSTSSVLPQTVNAPTITKPSYCVY
jgi:hypothetical protein